MGFSWESQHWGIAIGMPPESCEQTPCVGALEGSDRARVTRMSKPKMFQRVPCPSMAGL